MQRRHLFNFQVSNWWFQLYVAYFLNPLIEDYLEFFDTPAPVHSNYTIFSTRERNRKGKKVAEKQYLSVGDYLHVVIPNFIKISKISQNKSRFRFPGIFLNIPRNLLDHFPESSGTFPGIFWNIPQNLFEHSTESSGTFPGIFSNIPRNPLEHSPESSSKFPRICFNIPRNVKIITFPGILVNIPHVPRIPCIPFPVTVFLVL